MTSATNTDAQTAAGATSLTTTTTSASNKLHHLPSLPAIPPLQMPSYDSSQHVLRARDSFIDTPSTAISHASQDSFTTALSVSPSPPIAASGSNSSGTAIHPQPANAAPSPKHRVLVKSKSVDSFVKVPRPGVHPSSPTNEFSSSGETSALRELALDSVAVPDRRAPSRQRHKQHNRISVASYLGFSGKVRPRNKLKARASARSATDEDRDSSVYEDSDYDFKKSKRAKEGINHNHNTGQSLILATSSATVRNQPLSLNSESRPRAGVTSLPAINTNNLSARHPSKPQAKPAPSSAMPGSSSMPPVVDVQRARSHSVGAQAEDIRRRVLTRPLVDLVVNTRSLEPLEERELAFGVVGAKGCGKSAFIRKSLKRQKMTGPESCTVSVGNGSKPATISYSRSSAYVPVTSDSDICVSLYEVDIKSLQHEENESLYVVWPQGLPRVDGIFVCYDASDPDSFKHITELLAGYHSRTISTIVLACKSDLQKQILPNDAVLVVQPYAGIVEVSNRTESGKSKMRRCIDVFVKQALKTRTISRSENEPYRNPASPDVLNANHAPWNNTPTNTASSSASSVHEHGTQTPPEVLSDTNQPSATPTPHHRRSPSAPSSPTRARSFNDMIAEQHLSIASAMASNNMLEKDKSSSVIDLTGVVDESQESQRTTPQAAPATPHAPDDFAFDQKSDDPREQPPPPWATFEELLEKLFFLAVSGDDPSFISYFFLTFRRFATPRSVLLGMQKRMLELNHTTGDYILAAFAQQRICSLLEQWINEYPTDFAAAGTAGALSAFIKQILTHTHTLNYGSDFLPFLDLLPSLVDEDAAWAQKFEETTAESDESDSMFGEDNESDDTEVESPTSFSPHPNDVSESANSPRPPGRERKSSLPLSAKAFLQSTRTPAKEVLSRPSPKDILAKLTKASHSLALYDAQTIALEITRRELELFMMIERRHWLRHTLVPGRKDPNLDPVAKFNSHYNDLHRWAVSLILCHDKPKMRAKQIEKFAEIALRLRSLNNYSGMRAIITAINQSTYSGDLPMEIFKTTKPELHKKFLSSDILLRTTGSHQSYRMALRNTKGPCIPSVEVHTSDLRRAHEGNPDFKADDPSKIHWAKFNMIGKFVATTTQLQDQCRGPSGYNIPENHIIGQLFDVPIMDYDMQLGRMYPPADDSVDVYAPPMIESSQSKEGSGLRRLFFW